MARQRTRHGPALVLLGLGLILLSAQTHASGDAGPPPSRFVAVNGADVDPARLEAGRISVMQVGWPRLRLYAAWRAIALDAGGLPGPALPAGTVDRILNPRGEPGAPCTDANCLTAWYREADAEFQDPRRAKVTGTRMSEDYADYVECPPAAFGSAARTLASLRARPDATADRLRAWVQAQDAVFSNCDLPSSIPANWKNDSFRADMVARLPTPQIPTPLPPAEATVWREQREYQIAASLFHAGRLAEAVAGFQAIAAQPGHAMHEWGSYLALRATLRRALQAHDHDADSPAALQALAQLQQRATAILADPSQTDLHEPTRATLRRARARLTPAAYFIALSRILEDPSQQPTTDDRLGDWRMLSSKLLDEFDGSVNGDRPRFRAASPMVDWMSTIQGCATPSDLPVIGAGRPRAEALRTTKPTPSDGSPGPASCADSSAHALERWHAAIQAKNAKAARPWLVAYLLTTDTLPADVRSAALKTGPGAPEYLTLQAQLARLGRLADDLSAERAAAAAGLAATADTPEDRPARNTFLRARFDTAIDLAAAIADLERPISQWIYLATGETRAPAADDVGIDADGETWLDTRLGAKDLIEVSTSPRIVLLDRARIAVAAWLRADFSGQAALAERAANIAGDLLPRLRPLVDRYVQAPAASRHHVLLVGVLQFGLVPQVQQGWQRGEWFVQASAQDEVLANQWCRIASPYDFGADKATDASASRSKAENQPLPGVQSPALVASELARLGALPTATGMIGRDAIAWARQHPDDPQVPWLLHVTVQSTRGGCLDADAHTMSVSAYRLLHTRYPNDAWTKRTPFFF